LLTLGPPPCVYNKEIYCYEREGLVFALYGLKYTELPLYYIFLEGPRGSGGGVDESTNKCLKIDFTGRCMVPRNQRPAENLGMIMVRIPKKLFQRPLENLLAPPRHKT